MDISALRHYNTGTFGHKNILVHEHFGRRMSVMKYLNCFPHCQNVHEPKYPCVKMFQYRNFPVPKLLWSQIMGTHAEISLCQKVPMMKCRCWNVSCRNVRFRNKPKPFTDGTLISTGMTRHLITRCIQFCHCKCTSSYIYALLYVRLLPFLSWRTNWAKVFQNWISWANYCIASKTLIYLLLVKNGTLDQAMPLNIMREWKPTR